MQEKGSVVSVRAESSTDAFSSLSARFGHIKSLLQKEFGATVFRSWIAPIEVVSSSGGALELSVPTRFIRDWVRAHYADTIKSLWSREFGAIAKVDIVINARKAADSAAHVSTPVTANENANGAEVISSPLDARFTFDNFITDSSNELAAAAAKKVAASSAAVFNPLFLQGGVGLGKTHLMHAIAWHMRETAPARRVIYMSAEKFMYRFVQALRSRETMAFKEQFRSVDVLMIDDIQFICGKEATQEEFFHTFNVLIGQGKQIVVSADRSPSALEGLDEKLRSRLSGGLVADIGPTTAELRLRILQSKCAMIKRSLPQDVLEFLAQKITSNVRELEGALNRLIAQAELVGCSVTVESAQNILQDLLRVNDRRLSVEDIQKKVVEHYKLRMSDMLSQRRSRIVARPRQVAMYLAKALTEHSLPEIGRKFGGRDHTTIIHGVRKIEELLKEDRLLQEDVEAIKRAAMTGAF